MKELKFYKIALGFMVVLNIALMIFLIMGRPNRQMHSQRNNQGSSFLHEAFKALHLDEAQRDQFKEMAQKHGTQMESINKEQKDILKPYFQQLATSSYDEKKPEIIEQIKTLEGNKVELTLQHFKDVKSIMRPEQKDYYKEFVDKAVNRIL